MPALQYPDARLKRPDEGWTAGIEIGVVVAGSHMDRTCYAGYRCFDIAPQIAAIVGETVQIRSAEICELAIAQAKRDGEHVF